MGRFFSPVDHRRERPARAHQEGEDARPASMARHEAQEKLSAYIVEYSGRLTPRGSSDHNLRRTLEGFLSSKVRPVVEEDQGKPPVPFRQAHYSDHRKPTTA
jgi:hypothetical protein